MKTITVYGLGYVGVVTAACLAREGNQVIGIDINKEKVQLLNQGISTIVEEQIGELVYENVKAGFLRASTKSNDAVKKSDIIFVCVGTPSLRNGSIDLSYIKRVCKDIGLMLKDTNRKPLVVIRSTMLPGSMERVVIPALEESTGMKIDKSARVLFHPEFLREGSSVYDFDNPPKIVIGESEAGGGTDLLQIYEKIKAPTFIVDYKVAEMVKYCDNIFHALKITFANEVGQFCNEYDIDSHEVMKIFISDVKLNISDKYLMPGFAFGGSCLPKDLRAFNYTSRIKDINLPMLDSILPSNKVYIEKIAQQILNLNYKQIGVYGLSFKKGTDDLRESPLVYLVEILIGKGIKPFIYDEYVNLAKLIGGNKSFIMEMLPHISSFLITDIAAFKRCPVIILGHKPEQDQINNWILNDVKIIDLNHPGGHYYFK